MRFLRDNWVWILAPVVLVLVGFLLVALLGSDGDEPSLIYRIY